MSQPTPTNHYPPDVTAVQGGTALYDDLIARFIKLGDTPEQAHAAAHLAWPHLVKTAPAEQQRVQTATVLRWAEHEIVRGANGRIIGNIYPDGTFVPAGAHISHAEVHAALAAHAPGSKIHQALSAYVQKAAEHFPSRAEHETEIRHELAQLENPQSTWSKTYSQHYGTLFSSVPEDKLPLPTVKYETLSDGRAAFRIGHTINDNKGGFTAHTALFDARTGAHIPEHYESEAARQYREATPEELRIFQKDASYLAHQWQGQEQWLHDFSAGRYYLRFGLPPESGKSKNYVTGDTEKGVSAYDARLNVRTGAIEFADFSGNVGTGLLYSLSGERPLYLIRGDHVSNGSDGEPLLGNVSVVAHLQYDPATKGWSENIPMSKDSQ